MKKIPEVAAGVVQLRTEGERIAENQLTHGVVLISARPQVSALRYEAGSKLEQTIGRSPGQ
jgi:hypothetical protein